MSVEQAGHTDLGERASSAHRDQALLAADAREVSAHLEACSERMIAWRSINDIAGNGESSGAQVLVDGK